MLTHLQEINPSNTTQLSGAPGLVHHLFKNPKVRYYISGARQRVSFFFLFLKAALQLQNLSDSRLGTAPGTPRGDHCVMLDVISKSLRGEEPDYRLQQYLVAAMPHCNH